MTRGISQTPEMVRWCGRTNAYRVVGAPERRLARIGAVVAGNPARVIKQVADLTCPPGWFERPYNLVALRRPRALRPRRRRGGAAR